MWDRKRSVVLSIVVCFAFALVLALGLFFAPWMVTKLLTAYRGISVDGDEIKEILSVFCACFYPCSVFGFITLYSLLRLLFNIKKDEIFIRQNIVYLRRISWCCFAVAFIILVGGIICIPSFIFGAVAAAFVGLLLRVVKNVMENAAEIKAENELTI